MTVTSPVRVASTASSWYNTGTGTITATIPAGVIDGDTIIYVLQGSGHDAAVAPTFAATGAIGSQFTQAIYLRNTARNPYGQTLSVWILQNAPASMSSQQFTVTASQCIYSGQIFVLKGPMYVIPGSPTTTGTATSTTVSVAQAFDASGADLGVLSIAAAENAVFYSNANINVGTNLLLGSGYYQGQANCYSSHHIVTVNDAGPVTYTSDLAVSATTAQVGLTSTKPRGWDNKEPLTASGSIGGARGVKYTPPAPRAVSTPVSGPLAVPGTASVNVPAGVQNGDTILLLASAIASGGSAAQLTIAGTGALANFQHVIDSRHPTRGHCLSVFVLRNAAAALSGQALTVRGDSIGGTFYYLMQAMILPGSDYILGASPANSGAVASATITVPDLLGPGMPVKTVLSVAALDTAGGTAYAFIGAAIIAQAQFGSMGHMIAAGPVASAYTYTTAVGGYQATGQIGLTSVVPRGDANKHTMAASGAATARARVKVGAANKHPLAASGGVTGKGRKAITTAAGRRGSLAGRPDLRGVGVKMVWPIPPRAFSAAMQNWSGTAITASATIPATLQQGDLIMVLAVATVGVATGATVPVITAGTGSIQGFSRIMYVANTGRGAVTHTLALFLMPYAPASMAGTPATVIFDSATARSSLLQAFVFKGPARFAAAAAVSGGAVYSTDTDIPDLLGPVTADMIINVAAAMSQTTAAGASEFATDDGSAPIFGQSCYYVGAPYWTGAMMAGAAVAPGAYPYTFGIPSSLIVGQLALAVGASVGVDRTHPMTAATGSISGRGRKGTGTRKGAIAGVGTPAGRGGNKRQSSIITRGTSLDAGQNGNLNCIIPSVVQTGDTILIIAITSGSQTITPTGNLAAGITAGTWIERIRVANTSRAAGPTLAVWSCSNATPAMNNVAFALSVPGQGVARCIVLSKCGFIAASAVSREADLVTTPIAIDPVTGAELIIPVIALGDETNANAGLQNMASSNEPILYQNAYRYHSSVLGGYMTVGRSPAPIPPQLTYTASGNPYRAVIGQLALASTGYYEFSGRGTVAASGAITAQGEQAYPPAPLVRGAGAAFTGVVGPGASANVQIPAGVQDGDTLLLVVASAAPNGTATISCAWDQIVQAKNMTRYHGCTVFGLLRQAAADMSGTTISFTNTSSNGVFVARVIAFEPSLVRNPSLQAKGGPVTAAAVDAVDNSGDLLLPLISAASSSTNGPPATTITPGSGKVFMHHCYNPGGYTSVTLCVGWLSDRDTPLTFALSQSSYPITGQLVLYPSLDVYEFSHPGTLTAGGSITGRGNRDVTGQGVLAAGGGPSAKVGTHGGTGRGALAGSAALTGSGTVRISPVQVRAVGPVERQTANPFTWTVPAGVQSGDTVLLVVQVTSGLEAPAMGGVHPSMANWSTVAVVPQQSRANGNGLLVVFAFKNADASLSGTEVTWGPVGGSRLASAARFVILTESLVWASDGGPGDMTASPDRLMSVADPGPTAELVLPVVGGTYQTIGGNTPNVYDRARSSSIITSADYPINNATYYNASLLLGWVIDFPPGQTVFYAGSVPLVAGDAQIAATTQFERYAHAGDVTGSGGVTAQRGVFAPTPGGTGPLAGSGTVTGSGFANKRQQWPYVSRLAGAAIIVAKGTSTATHNPGYGLLTGTAAVKGYTVWRRSGHGDLAASAAMFGRDGSAAMSGHGDLAAGSGTVDAGAGIAHRFSWSEWPTGAVPARLAGRGPGVAHGEGDAEWTIAMFGKGLIVAGTLLDFIGVKEMYGHWSLDADVWINTRVRPSTGYAGRGALVAGSSITGTGHRVGEGHGGLVGDGGLVGAGGSARGGDGSLAGDGALACTGVHHGYGRGVITAGARLRARASTSKEGQGQLVASGTIGGGFGFERGGWAAPLIGVGSVRGQRDEFDLPCGVGTRAGYEEGLPQWATM